MMDVGIVEYQVGCLEILYRIKISLIRLWRRIKKFFTNSDGPISMDEDPQGLWTEPLLSEEEQEEDDFNEIVTEESGFY